MQTTTQNTEAHWLTDTLVGLGILTNEIGYRYLREAVELKTEEPELSMTKELYPTIAKRHNVSAMAVEKAMRFSIQTAFVRGNPEHWQRYFAADQTSQLQQPTNGQFVSRLAQCWMENG